MDSIRLPKKYMNYMRRFVSSVISICRQHWGATLLIFFFILAGSIVSILRYWQYETYYYDFGIFDRAIWEVSKFQAPIIDHLVVPGKLIFADHFSPGIFMLSPLYWFTNRQEMLLLMQTIFVGVSGAFLYDIGLTVLKKRLPSFAILVSYFLFLGVENAVITEFHEVTLSVLFLMMVLWSMAKGKKKWYIISFLLLLTFKESLFTLGAGIAIATYFLQPNLRKHAVIMGIVGLLYGIGMIRIGIPLLSGGSYEYGYTGSLLPWDILPKLISSPIKIHTILMTFWAFGFLPLLSPAFYAAILQDFIVRFVPAGWELHWGLGLHYSIQISAIMAVSSMYALATVQKFNHVKTLIPIMSILLILNACILYRFVLRSPLALAYNPAFYSHSKDFAFLDRMVNRIPGVASVMAQNNLLGRFTHHTTWLIREDYEQYKPDYILFDLRPDQSPNDFFGFLSFANTEAIMKKLQKDSLYKEVYKTDYQHIFMRIKPASSPTH